MTGAFAAFEGKGFADFEAGGAAEVGGASVSGGGCRVAPEEMALGAGPEAVEDVVFAVLLIEVGVAVARELARAAAHAVETRIHVAGRGYLQCADVGLVIAETLMFGGVFGADFDRHSGGDGHVDHDLVDALGVHVDLDGSAAGGDGFEERLPEGVAAFGDAAFAVDAHGEAGDLRAGFEQHG
jgi:hypothetical protein